ncbi:L-asparaginase [Salmonella enterica subsp. enterica serovar Arechavaleta]|nr:L-asparaginase [Salmonella enterica subsp. enterica serovar Arechavaleta]
MRRPEGRAWRVKPHVLRVRCGFCALSVSKLAAPITPTEIGS